MTQPACQNHDIDEDDIAEHDVDQNEDGFSLVGRFIWEMHRGDSWTVGPESVFIMRDISRRQLFREAYMLARGGSAWVKTKQVFQTIVRRFLTGEPLILDLYYAENDNAMLGISTDQIGSYLCRVTVDGPIIARKGVYFASQRDVQLRVWWPQGPQRWKKFVYGVGYVFQRFEVIENGTQGDILFQIDGDMELAVLKPDERLLIDPRHAYAWDASVSQHLVRFGPIWDQLLRGLIPYYTEFRGPGRVWYSTEGFSSGFLGYWGTPTAWLRLALDRVVGLVRTVLGLGSNG